MPKHKNNDKRAAEATIITTTDLPGMKDIKVIVSPPILIRENSSKPSKK